MFLLNDKPLPLDVPFITEDGTQYPANWLRLSSAEDKASLGITEVPDEIRADDRFYWDGDINNPKDLQTLKTNLITTIKQTAGSLLSSTDWKVVRAAEGVKVVDEETLSIRESIREASDANEAAINACTTVEELAALQFTWPNQGGL